MSKQMRKKSSVTRSASTAAGKSTIKARTKSETGSMANAKLKTTRKASSAAPPETAAKKVVKKTGAKSAATRGTTSRKATLPPETTAQKAVTLPKPAQRSPPAKAQLPVAKTTSNTAAPSQPAAARVAKSAVPATGLREGDQAPAFALPRDGGGTVALSEFSGRKLVVFFYPRADTPGCTREAIDFTRLAGDFEAVGATVLGVSADPLKAQEAFRDKHMLTTPLISDEAHAMLEAYGAWGEKAMYGRTFQGVLRTTVVIGADGRIAKVWRGVKVDGHADAVLAFVQTL